MNHFLKIYLLNKERLGKAASAAGGAEREKAVRQPLVVHHQRHLAAEGSLLNSWYLPLSSFCFLV